MYIYIYISCTLRDINIKYNIYLCLYIYYNNKTYTSDVEVLVGSPPCGLLSVILRGYKRRNKINMLKRGIYTFVLHYKHLFYSFYPKINS